ncbi:Bro-N domain-containing protein [Propionibacterium freudenreichii]|uniref:BRO-N domain-containing protein n=1 Tax=Propionibacterium freudenreichii TaxID=1744 RepID=UPI00254FA51C|nr:Bro-N domain-containing protein [Propionibacterium freudenreichii]MDK9644744.1 Bro-N domain-containing protein [Propionibacterium freudenreichii]
MSVIPFSYDDHPVRVIERDGEPWLVAADVCGVLTIANPRDALARLDPDEKGVGTTDTLGGMQRMAIISEAGVYTLAMTSRKPQAKPFVRWLSHEVIPSIRKRGMYATPAGAEAISKMAKRWGLVAQEVAA